MSDERKADQSEGTTESSEEETRSPDERLDDVGNKGTFDLEGSEDGEERESGTAGLPDEEDVPEETLKEIDEERESRLDPDNRPDNVEVDNTPRTFDSGAGMFTDNPDYDKDNRPYAGPDDSGPPEESDSGDSGSGDSDSGSGDSGSGDSREQSSAQDAPEDATDSSEAEEQESTEEASSEDEPARSAES